MARETAVMMLRNLLIGLGSAFLFLLLADGAFAGSLNPPQGTVNVVVPNVRNDHGRVICTLFNSAKGFPSDDASAVTLSAPISQRQAVCHFTNVSYGTYAIVAFHDENGDGVFNQNALGLPKEGFGFSNNPAIIYRAPTFQSAQFALHQTNTTVTVYLHYWF